MRPALRGRARGAAVRGLQRAHHGRAALAAPQRPGVAGHPPVRLRGRAGVAVHVGLHVAPAGEAGHRVISLHGPFFPAAPAGGELRAPRPPAVCCVWLTRVLSLALAGARRRR